MPVDDGLFGPVASSGYEVGRVPIPDGVHVLDGAEERFGVVIVGYDDWDSYAYLGGTGTGKINPNRRVAAAPIMTPLSRSPTRPPIGRRPAAWTRV